VVSRLFIFIHVVSVFVKCPVSSGNIIRVDIHLRVEVSPDIHGFDFV